MGKLNMKMTTHNTEQAARGYLMYQLAIRGYKVQLTDSRFPSEDMLVVSPKGKKHFGIDVKGQQTANFWQFEPKDVSDEAFFAFVFVPPDGSPRIFLMSSRTAMELWQKYKSTAVARGVKEQNRWGLNWKTPLEYEDRWDLLPV